MKKNPRVNSIAVPHPFIFTAGWLEKIGYDKETDIVFCNGDLHGCLVRLATVVRKDGKLNSKSPHAERFAICLAQQGHDALAMKLFLAITDGKENILLVHEPPELGRYQSSETADTPGKLGYKGVWLFGESALRQNQKELAKKLFQEIVERLSGAYSPITLTDTRVHALERLEELGVKILRSGVSLARELRTTKQQQY